MIENPDPANKSLDASPLAERVAGTTALLGVILLLGKGIGLLRELVIARSYGAGAELDAYLVALTVPEIAATVAFFVAVNLFLPIYMTERERSPGDADRLASVFWTRSSAVLLGVSGLLALGAPWIVRALAPGLAPELHHVSVYSLRLLSLIVFFRGMHGILKGLVNAHRVFVVPTVGAVLVSVVVIAGVFLGSSRWGVRALVWGVVAGNLVPVLVILPVALRRIPGLFRSLTASHPAMREVTRVLPWILVIELLSLALPLVDRSIAARFLGEGRISALSFARILNEIPLDFVGMTLSMILFPEFAALHARGDGERFRRVLRRGVRASVAVILPVAVLFIVLRLPLVRAVYERGAFTAEASVLTASALWAYALGLPFLTASYIATQAAYAARKLRTILTAKITALVLKIAVSLLLIDVLGHAGIALGTSVFFLVVFLFLFPALAGGWRGVVPRPGVLLAATAVAAGCGWGLTRFLASVGVERGVGALGGMVGVWVVSGLVYLGLCRLGRVEEVLWVESLIRDRLFGSSRGRRS